MKKSLNLLARGVPRADVARLQGLHPSNLTLRKLESYLPTEDEVRRIKAAIPGFRTVVQANLLIDMNDPARRKKASLNNTAYAYRQAHDTSEEEGIRSQPYAVMVRERETLKVYLQGIIPQTEITTSRPQLPEIIENEGSSILSPALEPGLEAEPVLEPVPRGEGRGRGESETRAIILDDSEKSQKGI